MNILQITSDWKWTGPAEPMLLVLGALRARGHEVFFSCPEPPDGDGPGVATMARERGVENRLALIRARGAMWPRDSSDALRLRSFLAREKIDLVHSWHTRDHVLAAMAVRGLRSACRVPVVRSYSEENRISGVPWNRLLFGPGCEGLLCAGERMASENSRFRGGRPTAAWWGAVSLDRFNASAYKTSDRIEVYRSLGFGNRALGGVIGIVARVQRHRRFDLLLEAMKKLVQTHPAAKLLVIGRGTHLEKVARVPAARLGLEDHVVFTGYRDKDYASVLASLDLLTFLVPGSDGTCRAVLEAAALGVPAVVTKRGALPEIVSDGETGLVVEEDAAVLAAAWRRLLDDQEERKKMGNAARRRAERAFSRDRAAERMEEFYSSVLANCRGERG